MRTCKKVDIHIDIAVNQLKYLVSFYENYRENGFMFVIVLAKIIVSVELEPKLHEKYAIQKN